MSPLGSAPAEQAERTVHRDKRKEADPIMSPAARDVDAYIAAAPEASRSALEKMRATIKSAAPTAEEGISYQVPSYKYKGRPLVHFGVAKKHVALYGAIPDAIDAKELAAYDTSKGTIRFPLGRPVPAPLVKKVVKARIAEIEAR